MKPLNVLATNMELARIAGLPPVVAKAAESFGIMRDSVARFESGGLVHRLKMRAGTDDLGVLHEICKQNLYIIPPGVIQRFNGRDVTVVDLGGHIGLSATVILAQLIHFTKGIQYHMYEPNPDSLSQAQINLSGSPYFSNVDFHYYCEAVGPEEGRGSLTIPFHEFNRGSFAMHSYASLGMDPNGNVQVVTVETVKNRLGGAIDIAKIDIEGGENGLDWQGFLQGSSLLFAETHDDMLSGSQESLLSAVDSNRMCTASVRGSNFTFVSV